MVAHTYTLYKDEATADVFGRRMRVLDLSHEISPSIPVYPGHMKVAMWPHLTHEECRVRIGETKFCGYSVMGISMCDHDSTHVDAISHFNESRQDLSIDQFPLEKMFTPGVWVDVSDAAPRSQIGLSRIRRAMDEAGVDKIPAGGTFLYYTGAAKLWDRPLEFCTQFPGLDDEASRWILDQGVVNIMTDAVSTDSPEDRDYPNHQACGEYLVNHTEVVANIDRIGVHQGFWVFVAPLRFIGGSGSPSRVLALWEA